MKHVITIALLIFTAALFAQTRQVIDKVVANIGSEVILYSDIEDQLAYVKSKQGNIDDNTRCGILESLLTQKLLVNQAKIDSVKVADEELEAELDARLEQILGYMNNNTQQFIDYYGKSPQQVKEEMRDDQKDQILMRKIRQTIGTDITITPAETRQFFNTVPKDSLPYFNSEVELGEIVMKPKVNPAQRADALKQIEDIRHRLVEGGEDFAKLASQYSEDFGSARNGGDLGFVKRGQFVPEFEASAYNLVNDEISQIVESEFGFHIIQLIERRGNTIHTRHILIKPKITDADLHATKIKLDSVRQLILLDSLTFSQAVKRYSDKSVQSFNNDGRMVNTVSGNNFFEIGDLDPEVYFAIDTLKEKGITPAMLFAGERGDKYYRIIQLQSRSKPHKANLQQDYAKISAAALEHKRNTYLNNWVLERVQKTFVHISDDYKSCVNMQQWLQNGAKSRTTP
ncbi:MAG: peptidylprolyl isomerase [Saprospiraceae bacterium]|nr:peptidylprolyl isomerase [Saprospiraceae bacterium]MBP7679981.1 peptidylprolyl isomerase [Saprospiraceae bacterium]